MLTALFVAALGLVVPVLAANADGCAPSAECCAGGLCCPGR